jgi:NitT/TauT family transport system ATP-binding protein
MAAPATVRKSLFRHAVMSLRLFQMLMVRLEAAPEGRVDANAVLDELATLLPYDQPAKLFQTIIAWGRYAELVDFDQDANVVYLHQAGESDDEEEPQTS